MQFKASANPANRRNPQPQPCNLGAPRSGYAQPKAGIQKDLGDIVATVLEVYVAEQLHETGDKSKHSRPLATATAHISLRSAV